MEDSLRVGMVEALVAAVVVGKAVRVVALVAPLDMGTAAEALDSCTAAGGLQS